MKSQDASMLGTAPEFALVSDSFIELNIKWWEVSYLPGEKYSTLGVSNGLPERRCLLN